METPPKHSRSWFQFADLAAAFALANLYMLAVWDELHDHFYDYYRDLPYQTWSVFDREIFFLVILALLFWPLIAFIPRIRIAALRKLGCVLLLGILLVGLDVARLHGLHFYGGFFTGTVAKLGALLLFGAAGCTVLFFLLFRDQALLRGIRHVLLFLMFLVPINLASTAWEIHSTWPVERYNAKQPARLVPVPIPSASPRFVWVIFDDWDEYLTFRNRPAGLQLPELDRFRSQSLHADTAFPPAADTLESLPSLITGRIVRKSRTTAPDDLLLTFAGSPTRELWSAQPNVFQRARESGVNGAIAGFYHPYPRIIGASTVESFSVAFMTLQEDPIYFSGVEGMQRIPFQIWDALHRVPLIKNSGILGARRPKRISRIDYEQVTKHALKMVANPALGLVMLHFPLPHPPGIYDRAHARVNEQSASGYIDNLALTDATLRLLRQTMEAAGQWDNSFILLSSDHPLKEDANRHPWIPFLLKTPRQTTSLSYAQPFNSVLSQELILAALRGQVRSPEDIAGWLDDNRSRYPAVPPQVASDTP